MLAGDPGYKQFRTGTDRAEQLSGTLARALAVAPAVGLTRIADITGLDHVGIPVAAAYRPNARSVSVSQGKGPTLLAARVSAAMEAIEGYHAERVAAPLRLGTVRELASRPDTVDLQSLPRTTTALNAADKLLWLQATELTRDQPRWLPLEVVQTDFTLPVVGCCGAFVMSSNGLASGNHRLEAVSHGLCELIERDANSLWHHASPRERAARRVAVETCADPTVREVLARFAAADVAVATWETTSDIGVACFLCEVADRRARALAPLPPTTGSGCHPRREVALLRALTEAAQGRLTRIAAVREDLDDRLYSPDEAAARLRAFVRDVADAERPRAFAQAPTFDSPTFADDVRWQIGRLAQVGLDSVLVVDLTQPALAIPVVRVVVPGLESMAELPNVASGKRAQAWKTQQSAR